MLFRYWKNKVLKNHLLFRHGLAEIIWGISHMTLRAYFDLTLAISKENNSKILYTNLFESHESSVIIVHRWEYTTAHTTWGKDFTDGLHFFIGQCNVEGFQ